MAWLKGFTYDGIESLDYDLYITSGSVYDAPERVVDMIKVPGRNGNLAIDRGKFENIDVEYNVYTKDRSQTSFAQNIRDFRNELCSRHEYLRLTDDYNSDEFRLGIYKSGLELDADIDRAGAIKLTFDCKPQRFLTSGETEKTIPEWSDLHTDSGSLVTVDNSSGEYAVKSLSTDIEPQQDLNGYDHPWAGGAGKNKLHVTATTSTINGVTFTFNSDGSIKLNGTATGSINFALTEDASLASDSYVFDITGFTTQTAGNGGVYANNASGTIVVQNSRNGHVAINNSVKRVWMYFNSGTTFSNNVLTLQIRLSSETDDTYEPYENICPITGFSSTNVTRVGKNLLPNLTYQWVANNLIIGGNSNSYYLYLKAGTYTFAKNTTKSCSAYYQINGDTASITITVGDHDGITFDTFTIAKSGYYKFWLYKSGGFTASDVVWFMLLKGTVSDIPYEPYAGTTYNVSFGSAGTVYGGTLDVVSGQLTVTKIFRQAVASELDSSHWGKGGSTNFDEFYMVSTADTYGKTGENYGVENIRCSHAPSLSSASTTQMFTRLANREARIVFPLSMGINSLNAFYAWNQTQINNNKPLQFCYVLQTPVTYQLTATQVALLLGTNNIWSNTGDISIEYGKGGNTLFNPTLFDSKPLLVVTGYGNLGINSQTLTIENGYPSQVVYIDCDSMEAWTETGGVKSPANDLIQNAGDAFPTLKSGMNAFGIPATITALKVTPRWWRI